MITKKIIACGILLLSTNLMLATTGFAQTTEQSELSENVEQIEVIEEEFVNVECVFRHEFDSMTDQEKEDLKDHVCEDTEVTTEELAEEVYTDESNAEQITEVEICIPPLEYDAMTDAERSVVESPLCEE